MTSSAAKMTEIVRKTPVNKQPAFAKMTKPPLENDRRPDLLFNAVSLFVRTHLVSAHDTNQRIEAVSLRPDILDEKIVIRWFLHHGMIKLGKFLATPFDLLRHGIPRDMAPFNRQFSRADIAMVLWCQPSSKVLFIVRLKVVRHCRWSPANAAKSADLDNVPCPLVY